MKKQIPENKIFHVKYGYKSVKVLPNQWMLNKIGCIILSDSELYVKFFKLNGKLQPNFVNTNNLLFRKLIITYYNES